MNIDTINKTCLEPYLGSFEASLASGNYKSATLKNYRQLLRQLGGLFDAENIAPCDLTVDLAAKCGRRLTTKQKSRRAQSLAKLLVEYLIEIGVAKQPPLTQAQAERRDLLVNFEAYLLKERGLRPRSVYHVLRFANRFLDHRFGDNTGPEQEECEIVRRLYQPKTATADLMMMPPSWLRRIWRPTAARKTCCNCKAGGILDQSVFVLSLPLRLLRIT